MHTQTHYSRRFALRHSTNTGERRILVWLGSSVTMKGQRLTS